MWIGESTRYSLIQLNCTIFMKKVLIEYGFPYSFSSTSKSDVFEFISKYNKNDKGGYIRREVGFKNLFPELYNDFLTWDFPVEWKFYQKLYHFLLDDVNLELGICPLCKNRCKFHLHGEFSYRTYCSVHCSNLSKEHINSQLNTWKRKSKEDIDKMIKMCMNTKIKKYQNPRFNNRKKSDETKHKNNTFGKSIIEKKIINWLCDNSIDFKYQYNTSEYPFNCDFYLPKYDLRIEIQGYFSHNTHPFNPNNYEDIKKVKEWNELAIYKPQYKNAIKIWTIVDPLKRETAKKNNLNFLEIFSSDLNECIKQIQDKIKELE